jgi:hypothetical protein
MNDPHKFGTGFGSDHVLEQSTPIVSRHDAIKWFEAIPGEQLCNRVHGTQVNGRYAIMENIAAPGTAKAGALPAELHAHSRNYTHSKAFLPIPKSIPSHFHDCAGDVQISVSEIAKCCYFPRQLAARF